MPTNTEPQKTLAEDLLPLTPPVFHILLALADEDRHGYGIKQEVKARTENQVHLCAGTLYGAIKRMQNDGLIEEVSAPEDSDCTCDERRRYYRLTAFGREVAQAEAARLARLVAQAGEKALL